MPSPTKRLIPRGGGPSSGSRISRGGGGASSSSLEAIEGRGGEGQRRRQPTKEAKKNKKRTGDDDDDDDDEYEYDARNAAVNPTLVGKRTGVTVPPRGKIPFDSPGGLYEDPDAFFDAARSAAKAAAASGSGGSHDDEADIDDNERRRRQRRGQDENARRRRVEEEEDKKERRRREREALEEEARRNAARRPDILNSDDDDDDDDDDRKDGEPRTKVPNDRLSYQRTPKQPGWTNRMLHRAMGIPTDESPANTVLSKVSAAAPSTLGSAASSPGGGGSVYYVDAKAASRHARREGQERVQLEGLVARRGGGLSPPAGGGDDDEEDQDDDNDDDHDGGPVDPPEETTKRDGNFGGRGVDPEEREDALEPEPDALENSLEEVVGAHYERDDYDDADDDGGGGGMQLTSKRRDQDEEEEEDAYFGGGGDDGGFDDDPAAGEGFRGGRLSGSDDSAKNSSEEGAEEEEKLPPEKDKCQKNSKKKKIQEREREPITPTSVLRTSKKSKRKQPTTTNRVNWSTPNGISRGIPAGNRDYEAVPISEYKDDVGEDPSLRRSRRAKFAPLQFWKNEKLVYEAQNEEGILGKAMGDMPVVAFVQKAQPTPYKDVKRTAPEKKKKKKDGKRKSGKGGGDSDEGSDGDDTSVSRKQFDDKALRKKYRVNNGESGKVWSETLESATDTKIVSRIDNRTFSKLPLSTSRRKSESKVVGFASQGFHVPTDDDDLFPGYIAGNVILPPRGIKDAEGVGLCSQVFNVGDCQPNSLEFALADPSGKDGEFDPKTAQRYLLSKGDIFQIPPGNVYRLENHSTTVKATLFWTIIKCTSLAEQEEDDSEED